MGRPLNTPYRRQIPNGTPDPVVVENMRAGYTSLHGAQAGAHPGHPRQWLGARPGDAAAGRTHPKKPWSGPAHSGFAAGRGGRDDMQALSPCSLVPMAWETAQAPAVSGGLRRQRCTSPQRGWYMMHGASMFCRWAPWLPACPGGAALAQIPVRHGARASYRLPSTAAPATGAVPNPAAPSATCRPPWAPRRARVSSSRATKPWSARRCWSWPPRPYSTATSWNRRKREALNTQTSTAVAR